MKRVKKLLERALDDQSYQKDLRTRLTPERLELISEGTVKISGKEARVIEEVTEGHVNAELLMQLNKDDLASMPSKQPTSRSSTAPANRVVRGINPLARR